MNKEETTRTLSTRSHYVYLLRFIPTVVPSKYVVLEA